MRPEADDWSGLADAVGDGDRTLVFHDEAVGDAIEHAEDEDQAITLFRQFEALGDAHVFFTVDRRAAITMYGQYVPDLDAIPFAKADRNHVVAPRLGDPVVDRHDTAIDRVVGGVGHIAQEFGADYMVIII